VWIKSLNLFDLLEIHQIQQTPLTIEVILVIEERKLTALFGGYLWKSSIKSITTLTDELRRKGI
jgi:hypothetical protein